MFGYFVEADDSQVGRSGRHHLGNVIVAQIEHFEREVGCLGEKFPFAVVDPDADVAQQGDTVFVQAAFGLDGYS